jgi:phage baseplate assembly protein W
MTTGISVKLPLQYSAEDGPYQMTKTLPETIKQNFKHLVLTVPGERVMNPDFGVGIHQLLFEHGTNEVIEFFKERLYDQTAKYLSFLNIINVEAVMSDHTLNIKIEYFIPILGASDELALDVTT